MGKFIESIIDWDKFDASSQISKRMDGVTKEHIEAEVDLWEQQLSLLTPLNFQAIKEEINDWDIGIPVSASINMQSLASIYAKLVAYKHRISYLIAEAKAWDNTCESAIDYIKDLAQGAYSGTAADKKSNAMHIVQPFVHLLAQTSRVLNYLEKIHSSVMFCAQQLDLLLKERQSQAKLNYKFGLTGEEGLTAPTEEQSMFPSQEDEEVFPSKEDGELFTEIKKPIKTPKIMTR